MEALEIEFAAEARPELGSDVEPGPLAHLVADRLRRHPAVALELAQRESRPAHIAVPPDEGEGGVEVPDLPRQVRLRSRDLELQVETDVDDHPHGPEGLCGEHPK